MPYELQVDTASGSPKLIRCGKTINNELVVNPHRTVGFNNFSEDTSFRNIHSGGTFSSNITNTSAWFQVSQSTASVAGGSYVVRFKMPNNPNNRHLKVTVTGSTSDAYVVLVWNEGQGLPTDQSYSSYDSPTWYTTLNGQTTVQAGQTTTLPFPDYRCRCRIEYYLRRSDTNVKLQLDVV